jgi:hypothetical protein
VIFLEKEKELFFVDIKDPVDVRRNVLEAQKEVVECLQKYEKIRSIRARKIEEIHKLKSAIKELLKLISNLKAAFPQAKIREAVKIKRKVKKKVGKKKGEKEEEKKEARKPISELQKLESELGAIEGKLDSLR